MWSLEVAFVNPEVRREKALDFIALTKNEVTLLREGALADREALGIFDADPHDAIERTEFLGRALEMLDHAATMLAAEKRLANG